MSGFRRNALANALMQQDGPPQMAADLEWQLQDALSDYQGMQMGMNQALGQGGWGSVGAALGALFTKGSRDKARGKISTLMREYFNAQNNEQARADSIANQKAQAEQDRRLAALTKRYGQDDAEAIVYGGLSPKDLQKSGPKYFKVGDQVVSIGDDGKASVAYDAPDAPKAAAVAPSPFGEGLQAAVDAGLVSPEEAAKLTRQNLGVDQMPEKPKALSADARNKIALLNNAISNATKYRTLTFGEGDEFRDIASRLGATPQLLKSAVQDSLYVKTGASAPAEEVAKAEAMYLPATVLGVPTERDATAREKVDNFIRDMTALREGLMGGGQSAVAEPAAVASAAPAAGQVVDGYRFKGGDPANPANWERAQ